MKFSLGYIALGATLLVGTATAFTVRTPQQQTNSLSRSWAVSRGGETPSSASSSSALRMSSDEFVKNAIESNEVSTRIYDFSPTLIVLISSQSFNNLSNTYGIILNFFLSFFLSGRYILEILLYILCIN